MVSVRLINSGIGSRKNRRTVNQVSNDRLQYKFGCERQNSLEDDRTRLCDILNIPLTDVIDLTMYIDRGPLFDSGGSGQVHRGRWKNTVAQHQLHLLPNVAMKVILLPTMDAEYRNKRRIKEMKRELELWSKLRHRNILPLFGFAHIDGDPCMPAFISPWMQQGNAIAFLNKNPCSSIKPILYDIIKGLSYLHRFDPTIIHGDLKAANVLVNDHGEACLCDFGLSRFTIWQTTVTHVRGTLPWMAPELHEPVEEVEPVPTQASDIYAYGMTCYEIVSGETPFSAIKNGWGLVKEVLKGRRPERIKSCPDDIWTLITRCWAQNPLERLTTDEVVTWMQSIVQSNPQQTNEPEKSLESGSASHAPIVDWSGMFTPPQVTAATDATGMDLASVPVRLHVFCRAPHSPFARPSLDSNSISVVPGPGSRFPKAQKNDIEARTAWRIITSHPMFKNADINDLCAEFIAKARCDGTKVVLEPQDFGYMLQSFTKK